MFPKLCVSKGDNRESKGAFMKNCLSRFRVLVLAPLEEVQKAVLDLPQLAFCPILEIIHETTEVNALESVSQEEKHLFDYFSEDHREWIAWKSLNERSKFSRMRSPSMRPKVFLDSDASKCFSVKKGPYGRTGGRNGQEARESLERMTKFMNGDLKCEFERVRNADSDPGGLPSKRNEDSDSEDVLCHHFQEVFDNENPPRTTTDCALEAKLRISRQMLLNPATKETAGKAALGNDASVFEWDVEIVNSTEIDAELRRQGALYDLSNDFKPRAFQFNVLVRFLISFIVVTEILGPAHFVCLALSSSRTRQKYVGFDLGTSGARISIIEENPSSELLNVKSRELRFDEIYYESIIWKDCGSYDDPDAWLVAVETLLGNAAASLDDALQSVSRICVSGTSASCLAVDRKLKSVTRHPRMYDYDIIASASETESASAERALACIKKHVPARHTARARTGSLAKLLSWCFESPWKDSEILCHQSDFVSMKLMEDSAPVMSDWHNCLKLGYDIRNDCWPDWMVACLRDAGIRRPLKIGAESIPMQVISPGQRLGAISRTLANRFGLPAETILVGGTTDSNAAFFAAAGVRPPVGTAVTSLGSTTSIKLLSEQYIEHADRGVYSHRFPIFEKDGDNYEVLWLVGGASNVGCSIFQSLDFCNEELETLSAEIDPATDSPLHYYPLVKPGERFPRADSNKKPILDPVPESRLEYLHGLMQSISIVEMEGFQVLQELGGPLPTLILSCGGGSKNEMWNKMRQRILARGLGVPNILVEKAGNTEASYGAALLAAASDPTLKNR